MRARASRDSAYLHAVDRLLPARAAERCTHEVLYLGQTECVFAGRDAVDVGSLRLGQQGGEIRRPPTDDGDLAAGVGGSGVQRRLQEARPAAVSVEEVVDHLVRLRVAAVLCGDLRARGDQYRLPPRFP